ncbi:A24 family peptidase [Alkalinema sp. FACHB-956]|uniref:prepilin peptidase n=1 Tax=Alkalinema sp. FACHB-956 TaxID=2692768 RepID=UPI001684E15E|nr:A24 family peptidase [Alkalinema sp. FACHB-956]MBD2329957.1 prepilin peptidase [Alkalinema sp. FACHB-956]
MDFLFELPIFAFVLFLGASIGSFLNVVIYRLPAGLSLIHPPSRCPHCLTPLRKRENLPVIGWLLLRGKCAHCQAPIAARYPLVELITGLLFLATFLHFGWTWQTLGYWVLISWLLSLALIDLDTLTLPNVLTQSGLVFGLAFQTTIGIATTQTLTGGIHGLMTGVIAAVLGVWLLDIITWLGAIAFGKPAMGGGDAKLFAMLGAWLGWQNLLLSGFLACALGAFVGGGAIALRLLDRQKPIPFGPFLALGALIAVFWGNTLISGYLNLFFPTLVP